MTRDGTARSVACGHLPYMPILAPAGSTFGVAPAGPQRALSPDGTQLAFVAPSGSNLVVWVQTIGNPEARSLVGTEGSDAQLMVPFWSPDGQVIAFAADGRLKRIARRAVGRHEITADGIGGAWAPTARSSSGRLRTLPGAGEGGDAESLTESTQRVVRSRTDSQSAARWEAVPYLVLDARRQRRSYLGSLDGRERAALAGHRHAPARPEQSTTSAL
jgi:hypothetical protein